MNSSRGGTVVAAHSAAAEAGAHALRAGGSAVDAAVATALALAVVDPANCGLGGHGGAMVVQPGAGSACALIDFNTSVPEGYDTDSLRRAPQAGHCACGGPAVSVPNIVAGLGAAHAKFGRLPWSDLAQPAAALARDGIVVNADLERSLAWAAANHPALSPEFHSIFFPNTQPLRLGDRLTQPRLAETLETIGSEGAASFRHGPIVAAICRCVTSAGGTLSPADMQRDTAVVSAAAAAGFDGALIYGGPAATSGYGILVAALQELGQTDLGASRGVRYAEALCAALSAAWLARRASAAPLMAEGHTSHVCACDGEGMLVSMTITHGPTWFGAGLVVPETGMVLNSGANLFVRLSTSSRILAIHNMCPVIVAGPGGARHAIGSPGGSKIPAIVLQAVIDAVRYDQPLANAIARPRISVDPAGQPEVEGALLRELPRQFQARRIDLHEYYGPASALSLSPAGPPQAALDPRFSPGIAVA